MKWPRDAHRGITEELVDSIGFDDSRALYVNTNWRKQPTQLFKLLLLGYKKAPVWRELRLSSQLNSKSYTSR